VVRHALVGQNFTRVAHLTCRPPGGTFPNAATICARLEAHPRLITAPKTEGCLGETADYSFTGRIAGRPISQHLGGCIQDARGHRGVFALLGLNRLAGPAFVAPPGG
jgi:hypothetical protein